MNIIGGRNKFSIRKSWLEKNEKNNVTIALNVLNAKYIYIYIYPAYVSKQNSNFEKQVIPLMIQMEKCEAKSKGWQRLWNYLALKKPWALVRWIKS